MWNGFARSGEVVWDTQRTNPLGNQKQSLSISREMILGRETMRDNKTPNPPLLFLLGISLLFLGASTKTQQGRPDDLLRAPYVTPVTVQAWQKKGKAVLFLDVRQADEFEAGHLPGAIKIGRAHV